MAPAYKLVITYEAADRPDVLWGYRRDEGVASVHGTIREPKRIDRIEVFHQPDGAGATLVRRYELTYEAGGGAGGRSRLQSVQECAGAAGTDCFPATTFTWQNGTAGWGSENATGSTAPAGFPLAMDINGDGREDLVWPLSTAPSGTWLFMLANASGGFGAAQNTGVLSTNFARAFPIEWNGDGRMDLIVPLSGNTWWVLPANGAGFGAAINTGVSSVGHFWFADIDADGRDDLIRAVGLDCATESNLTQIYTRLRSGSGFALETSALILQGCPYGTAPLGEPYFKMRSATRRPDFNGDGREDYLIALEAVIPQLPGSQRTYSTRQVLAGSTSGAVLSGVTSQWRFGDVNGDGLTDLGYHSGTNFILRYSRGNTLGASVTVALGSTYSPSQSLLADWDEDGLDDYAVRHLSTSRLWVARAQPTASFAPLSDSGMVVGNFSPVVGDPTGDGLDDLLYSDAAAGGAMRYRVRNGLKPDLLDRVTDGFGVVTDFDYAPLSNSAVHTPLSGSVYPTREYAGPEYVVQRHAFSDGIGGMAHHSYRYTGARMHLLGRGFLGFAQRITTDSRTGIITEESFHQNPVEYAFLGLPTLVEVKQSTGTLIAQTTLTWNKLVYGSGAAERRFPYLGQQVLKRYEVGGTYNGSLISTTTTTNSSIDLASGLIYDSTVTVVEATSANGLQPAVQHSTRVYHPLANLANDTANWCLGRPGETQLTRAHTATGGTSVTRTSSQSWDTVNCRPTQVVLEPASTQWKVTTDLVYDDAAGQSDPDFGHLVQVSVTGVGMSARTTRQSFGATGVYPVSFTNALGQSTQVGWNAALGVAANVTDPNGLTTTWQYDAFGRPTRESRPDGTARTLSYQDCATVAGGCISSHNRMTLTEQQRDTADAVLHDALIDTDSFDRILATRTRMLSGAYNRVDREYDALGRVDRQSVPCWWVGCARYWIDYGYDLLNRLTEVARPVSDADPTAQRTNAFYEGLTTRSVDPQGRQTTQVANALGAVVRSIDAGGYYQNFFYEAFGQMVQITDSAGQLLQTATYNVRGQRTAATDADRGSWSFTPNALGELTALTDANGKTLIFSYDALSRPTSRVQPEGTGTITHTFTWGSSEAARNIGRLAWMESSGTGVPTWKESYTYDTFGRLSQTRFTEAGTTDYYVDRAYQASTGWLDALTYPTSTGGYRLKLRYEYQNGQLVRIKDFNSPSTTFWQANATDARGQVIDEHFGISPTLPAGLQTIRGFDLVTGWLDYIQSGPAANGTLQNLSYRFDRVGNLTERRDLRQGLTEAFFYDTLYRLDYSTLNGTVNLDLSYNALGNITDQSGVGAYTYHPTKIHAVQSIGGGSPNSYDANGNITAGPGRGTVSWYHSGLAKKLDTGLGYASTFYYGPDGRRFKHVSQDPGATETTIYLADLVEKVTTGSATDWRHYIHAPTGAVAVYIRRSAGTPAAMAYYLTRDHLGNVDAITDASGAVQVRLSYSAFGQRRREAGWAGDPTPAEWNTIYAITHRGYTFHEMIDDLDIIHMNGRLFDPYAARFASADPFIPDPLDPQSHNRYSYVRNNPLSFIDPSGFDDEEDKGDDNGGAPGPHVPEITVIGERILGRDLRPGDFGPVPGTALPIVTGPSGGGTGTADETDEADEIGEIVVRAKKFKRRSRPRMLLVNTTKGEDMGKCQAPLTFAQDVANRKRAAGHPDEAQRVATLATSAVGFADTALSIGREVTGPRSQLAGDLRLLGNTASILGAAGSAYQLGSAIHAGDAPSATLSAVDLTVMAAGVIFPPSLPFVISYGGTRAVGDVAILISDSAKPSLLETMSAEASCR